jgi:drug/metabolite transporter (DMT)-like permease
MFIKNPYVQIHIAVFLWGFTAILGKLISLDAIELVFFRMSLAALGYVLIPKTREGFLALSKKKLSALCLIGTIICLHWLSFYGSIKVANSSSLALACLGTGPLFTAWLEPLFNKEKKIALNEIFISILAIIGIIFIAFGDRNQNFEWNGAYFTAMLLGILASVLAAIFSLMNKHFTAGVNPFTISFVEMTIGALLLSLFLLATHSFPQLSAMSTSNWIYILILSTLCTNIPFLLSIFAIKKLNPFVITLTVNLEPIYGFIFAAILFHEYNQFSLPFYFGSLLILLSVFVEPIQKYLGKK